jgi:hypothetical protein
MQGAKTMKPTKKLSKDALFFFRHAGYSYGNGQTAEEGRTECSLRLADAEKKARAAGISFQWEIDPDIKSADWIDPKEDGDEYRGPWETWKCIAIDGENNHVASLSGIDFGRNGEPWGDNYRRVVEAELALEAIEGQP